MAKATRVNSTPRRTASLRRMILPAIDDPAVTALELHQRAGRYWLHDLATAPPAQRQRACDAAEAAAWRLARTRPTTVAGAAALLTYITTGPITGMFELGECAWHETAFRNVAASLAKITQRAA